MVTNELRGERVDVVPFSDDPVELIQSALAPARVREVRLDDETGTATVIVSDYQLSLAIGKEGQNARLAARLTGWRIDIKSETQLADEESGYAGEEWAEGEWVQNEAGEMVWQPAEGGTAVSATEWSQGAEGPRGAAVRRRGRRRGAEAGTPPAGDRGPASRRGRVRGADGAAADAGGHASAGERHRTGRFRHSPGPDLHRVPADRSAGRADPGGPADDGSLVVGRASTRSGCVAVPGLARVLRAGRQAEGLRPGLAGPGRARRWTSCGSPSGRTGRWPAVGSEGRSRDVRG